MKALSRAARSRATAVASTRAVADQIRPKVPKLAAIMTRPRRRARLHDLPERELYRPKLHSINPIERINGEIK